MKISDIVINDKLSLVWFDDGTGNYWEQFLVFNFETNSISTDERRHGDNSIPGEEWHGIANSIRLPENVDAIRLLVWLMEPEMQAQLEKVVAGFSTHRCVSGSWKGLLTPEAEAAWYNFEHKFLNDCPTLDEGGPMDARDYWDAVVETYPDHATIPLSSDKQITITAHTTDDEITHFEELLESEARSNGYVIYHTTRCLETLRERCDE